MDISPQIVDTPAGTSTRGHRSRCYILFPCFDRPSSIPQSPSAARPAWWRRIRPPEAGEASLWARGVVALRKIREWSEIVAGPRWKTFIRRFNRSRAPARHANFQYDSISYAMNFDEGGGRSDEEGGDGYYYGSRNFSSRYAKGSVDIGRDGTPAAA
ncbi:NHL domain-containing protein [Striga asiatica]|uniref:NHL domain-containing protein n=1 Tax=Striga asiatica TaxID=4170 RepID=A0A5A7RI12_STRAF|nr:NHL domain-containing protein [Striga asiatica]